MALSEHPVAGSWFRRVIKALGRSIPGGGVRIALRADRKAGAAILGLPLPGEASVIVPLPDLPGPWTGPDAVHSWLVVRRR
jgi:hypothetical protein